MWRICDILEEICDIFGDYDILDGLRHIKVVKMCQHSFTQYHIVT